MGALKTRSNFIFIFLSLSILITPIVNFTEFVSVLNLTIVNFNYFILLKLTKDILIIYFVIYGYYLIVKNKLTIKKLFILIFLLSFISISISILYQDKLVILSGIRWILPLVLFPIFYSFATLAIQKSIAKLLIVFLFIGFLLQIIQLLFSNGMYGLNSFGYSLRNPGFYLIPSSMAMFISVSMFYSYFYLSNKLLSKSIVYVISPIAIFLTASGTGYVSILLFYLVILIFKLKQKKILTILMLILSPLILLLLPYLTGREDIISSLLTRVDILYNLVDVNTIIVSNGFGITTNTAKSLSVNYLDSITGLTVDSTINSLIGNLGLVITVMILYLFFNKIKNTKYHLIFLAVFMPYFLTIIVFELFPMNIFFILNIAILYKYHKEEMFNENTYNMPSTFKSL